MGAAVDRRAINVDAAFTQKICDILIRKRVPQIHPHGAQNNQCWKTVTFEGLSFMRSGPLSCLKMAVHKLMQQSPLQRISLKQRNRILSKPTCVRPAQPMSCGG